MYADSFRDLANTFLDIQKEEETEPTGDRQEYIWKKGWWKTLYDVLPVHQFLSGKGNYITGAHSH